MKRKIGLKKSKKNTKRPKLVRSNAIVGSLWLPHMIPVFDDDSDAETVYVATPPEALPILQHDNPKSINL